MYQHRQNYKYQCSTCPNHYGTNYKNDYTRHTMRSEHKRFKNKVKTPYNREPERTTEIQPTAPPPYDSKPVSTTKIQPSAPPPYDSKPVSTTKIQPSAPSLCDNTDGNDLLNNPLWAYHNNIGTFCKALNKRVKTDNYVALTNNETELLHPLVALKILENYNFTRKMTHSTKYNMWIFEMTTDNFNWKTIYAGYSLNKHALSHLQQFFTGLVKHVNRNPTILNNILEDCKPTYESNSECCTVS